jgi:transcriptional regulator with XRE-family HTH domain
MNINIKPEVVRQLRKQKGLSRATLSEVANFSVRQIARIENCEEELFNAREYTVNQLAMAFNVSSDVLRGEKPIPENSLQPSKTELDPRLQLKFDLVGFRYNISTDQLIAIAPLLFTMFAEATVKHHHKKGEKCDELMQEVTKLSGVYDVDYEIEPLDYRSRILSALEPLSSIRDISGSNPILDGYDFSPSSHRSNLFGAIDTGSRDWYEDIIQPFATYLQEFLAENEINKEHVRLSDEAKTPEFIDWDDSTAFSILEEDLKQITDDNEGARTALEEGRLRLSDVPPELYGKDKAKERGEWLADETSKPKDPMAKFREFSLGGLNVDSYVQAVTKERKGAR